MMVSYTCVTSPSLTAGNMAVVIMSCTHFSVCPAATTRFHLVMTLLSIGLNWERLKCVIIYQTVHIQ